MISLIFLSISGKQSENEKGSVNAWHEINMWPYAMPC
jgi:hypothetical protein